MIVEIKEVNMKKSNILTVLLTLIVSLTMVISSTGVQSKAAPAVVSVPQSSTVQYTLVNPLEVVNSPYRYLRKHIRIKAKFDKFSTLGLDYAPAMRSSEDYISFLIQRPDVPNHNIPLSELKIFLKKDVAEKNIDLDAGDEVEFTGTVFSAALGDAWMDVNDFKVLTKKDNIKKDDEKKTENK